MLLVAVHPGTFVFFQLLCVPVTLEKTNSVFHMRILTDSKSVIEHANASSDENRDLWWRCLVDFSGIYAFKQSYCS